MCGTFWLVLPWDDQTDQLKENIVSIHLEEGSETLYLKAKTWGVAGNHEQIVLSAFRDSLARKSDDYIFYTSEIFYKVHDNRAVIIYVAESAVSGPSNKIPNVTIKGLKTADEIRDYTINFKKYGLERISFQ